jgi:hypothetical protein
LSDDGNIQFEPPRTTGIAPILLMLPQLSSISVTCDFTEDWSILPAEFREAFVDRLSILKGVSIDLLKNFPLCVFDGCKTVKSITLHECADLENISQIIAPPVLDSLSLHSWRSVDSRFLAWTRKCIHSLRFLSFHSSDRRAVKELLPCLVGMCAKSLRSLEIRISSGLCKLHSVHFFFQTEQ